MGAKRETCPQCGESVYPTDDTCMSCGAALSSAEPEAPAPPVGGPVAAPPQPTKADYRPPIQRAWYHDFVESCGRAWDIFPWAGLAFFALMGMTGLGHGPVWIQLIIGALALVWYIAFFAWLVIDVKYFEEAWFWIPLGWLCLGYPLIFVVYWFRTR